MHPTLHAWPNVFLLMETYCAALLSDDTCQQKSFRHTGPHAKMVKTLDPKVIRLLALEKNLLVDGAEFFRNVVKHYSREPHDGVSEETKVLAIATLMKALGQSFVEDGRTSP